jgi:hypothetical protein
MIQLGNQKMSKKVQRLAVYAGWAAQAPPGWAEGLPRARSAATPHRAGPSACITPVAQDQQAVGHRQNAPGGG